VEEKSKEIHELPPTLSWGDALSYISRQEKIIRRLKQQLEIWTNSSLENKQKLENLRGIK
jgi:hypothetical protein